MSKYYGNITEDAVIELTFNTFNSSGASVTVTDLALGDINIHKDGGTTQRTSTSGITLSIDFDGITGNHLIVIDTSDNTDVGFYAVGSNYEVRLEGITVDSQTINAFIGSFSIENRYSVGGGMNKSTTIIQEGQTDVTTYFKLVNALTGLTETGLLAADIILGYVKDRGNPTGVIASDLSAANDAHSDGGVYEVLDGLYRVDYPDAAFTAGTDRVQLRVSGTTIDMAIMEAELSPSVKGGKPTLR